MTREERRIIIELKARIRAYALVLAKGVITINGDPVANSITELLTELREIEAVCGPDIG